MIDYVLKFPSEEKSVQLAAQAGLIESDKLVRWSPQYGIFVQGIITQPAPLDAQGKPVGKPVTLDGWWVRVRIMDGSPIPPEFVPYVTDERPAGLWEIA